MCNLCSSLRCHAGRRAHPHTGTHDPCHHLHSSSGPSPISSSPDLSLRKLRPLCLRFSLYTSSVLLPSSVLLRPPIQPSVVVAQCVAVILAGSWFGLRCSLFSALRVRAAGSWRVTRWRCAYVCAQVAGRASQDTCAHKPPASALAAGTVRLGQKLSRWRSAPLQVVHARCPGQALHHRQPYLISPPRSQHRHHAAVQCDRRLASCIQQCTSEASTGCPPACFDLKSVSPH
jgi:hypothetical protein